MKTIHGPAGWRIVLDGTDYDANDPGASTPAMLYGPRDACATFLCALDTGETDDGPLPATVLRWLEQNESEVCNFIDSLG